MSQNNINDFLFDTINNLSTIISDLKVVGEPIYISKGEILIPLSKVSFGFGAGGANYKVKDNLIIYDDYPFGGGSLGGLTMVPEAFLYIVNHECKVINVKEEPNIYKKALDLFFCVAKKGLKK